MLFFIWEIYCKSENIYYIIWKILSNQYTYIMKELNDHLQLLPFAPYIYGDFDVDKNIYHFTGVIKNNNINNKILSEINSEQEIQKLQKSNDLLISSTHSNDIYIWISEILSDLITQYYNIYIADQINNSVRWEDFIFGMVIDNLIQKIIQNQNAKNIQSILTHQLQLIKSFAIIDQKIFTKNTVVTDISNFDNEDNKLQTIYGLTFGKVENGASKNPILKIAKKINDNKRSEYIYNINNDHNILWENIVGNGREKILFDFDTSEKPKLLLHICCAPDLTYPLYWLKRYFKIYLFWYNPNIHPRREHDLRYEQYLKLFDLEEWDYEIVEDRYDPKEFFASFGKYRKLIKDWLEELSDNEVLKVAGDMEEWSSRCDPCYLMRLEQAATMAAKLDIPYFTSTLLISPKKVATKLFRRGLGAQERVVKSKFLRFDFAKKDGYNKASELTKDYDLYRQNYCGCGWTIPKKWEPAKEYRGG